MFKGWKFVALMFAFMLPMALADAPALLAQNTAKVHKLVIQVSRDDPDSFNLALGNAVNYRNYYDSKHEQFQVEIVAYGPGITMLREDKSPVKDRIAEAKKAVPGLVLSMCGNAKAAAERREGHEVIPLAGVQVVPAGIVRLAELQEQGYAYARP